MNLLSLFEMSLIFDVALVFRLTKSSSLHCSHMCHTFLCVVCTPVCAHCTPQSDVCIKMIKTSLTTVETPLVIVQTAMFAVSSVTF